MIVVRKNKSDFILSSKVSLAEIYLLCPPLGLKTKREQDFLTNGPTPNLVITAVPPLPATSKCPESKGQSTENGNSEAQEP